jgi:hypothetical protein
MPPWHADIALRLLNNKVCSLPAFHLTWQETPHEFIALSAVTHTTHTHGRHGSQPFRCCLNRKMLDQVLDMPQAELSELSFNQREGEHLLSKTNIYAEEGDWEVVM